MEHEPQLSLWPPLVGLGAVLIAIGVLATWILIVIGVALLLYSLWSWSAENRILYEMHAEHAGEPGEESQHE
jgi:hypothetical protein